MMHARCMTSSAKRARQARRQSWRRRSSALASAIEIELIFAHVISSRLRTMNRSASTRVGIYARRAHERAFARSNVRALARSRVKALARAHVKALAQDRTARQRGRDAHARGTSAGPLTLSSTSSCAIGGRRLVPIVRRLALARISCLNRPTDRSGACGPRLQP